MAGKSNFVFKKIFKENMILLNQPLEYSGVLMSADKRLCALMSTQEPSGVLMSIVSWQLYTMVPYHNTTSHCHTRLHLGYSAKLRI